MLYTFCTLIAAAFYESILLYLNNHDTITNLYNSPSETFMLG